MIWILRTMALMGALVMLTACGGPMRLSVYGASGKAYTAPDLCAALVACQSASESSCYYETELLTNADGTHMESGCKKIGNR